MNTEQEIISSMSMRLFYKMMYFVKSRFYGWKEVSETQYNRFINNIRVGATAMNEQQKEELIKKVTKVKP